MGSLATQVTGLLEVVETIKQKNITGTEVLVHALDEVLQVARDCGDYMLRYGSRSSFGELIFSFKWNFNLKLDEEHLLFSVVSKEAEDTIKSLNERLVNARNNFDLAMAAQNVIKLQEIHEDTKDIKEYITKVPSDFFLDVFQ